MGNRRIVTPIDEVHYIPKLNSSLYVPSFVHGYSLAVEFMMNWFKGKFKDPDFFKSVNLVGKHVLDEFRKYEIGELVSKERPQLLVNPQINFDYDREVLDSYYAGPEALLGRSDPNRAFLKDIEHNVYLGLDLQQLECNFAFRIRLRTKAQQYDLFKKMELLFKIGNSETHELVMDFHIPYDLMAQVALDIGFHVDEKGSIVEERAFGKWLNAHSERPILLKFRAINQRFEYFLRLNNTLAYITCFDKMSPDEGERVGHVDKNFNIDMAAILKLVIPQFYVYFSTLQASYQTPTQKLGDADNLVNDELIGSLYSIKRITIPPYDNHGWLLSDETDYVNENDENLISIDMKPFLNDGTIGLTIDKCLSDFISPDSFIHIRVFSEDSKRLNEEINCKMNWKTYELELEEPLPKGVNHLAVYIDREIKNTAVIQADNSMNTRYNVQPERPYQKG